MTKKTFTLLELVIVLLIIGALATLSIEQYMDSLVLTKMRIFEENVNEITKTLSVYKSNSILYGNQTNSYPISLVDSQFKALFKQEPKNPYTNKPMLSDNPADSGIQYVSDGTSYKLCVVQRDVDDVNNNGVIEEVLPLSTKTACIGNTQTSVGVTFARNSVAYTSGGTQVGVNVPRFEAGKFGKAIMIEEGTTNIARDPLVVSANIPSTTSGGTWGDWTFGSWNGFLHEKVTAEKFPGYAIKVTYSEPYSGGQDFWNTNWKNGITPGNTYTLSFYAKGNGTIQIRCHWAGTLSTIVLTPQITRYSVTFTHNGTTSQYPFIACATLTSGQWAHFEGFQLEQKPYTTSFIDGTRAPETWGNLRIPTAGVLNPQEGTVEFWVKPLIVTDYNNFFSMETSNGRFLLFFSSSFGHRFDYGPNNSGPRAPAETIMANNWYHIVLRWSATTGKQALFVNGVKYEQDLPNGVATSFPSTVSIVNNYSAYIDDLRISNRARTDEEIAAAYASGQPLPVDAWTTLKLDFNGDLSTQSGVIP